MRKRPPINQPVQLNLFRDRPLTPHWLDLTLEARHPAAAGTSPAGSYTLLVADRTAEVSDE